jgi:uncharacterized membrane protein (UPF0127 family)
VRAGPDSDRFSSLPRAQVLGLDVPVATDFRSRLLGLAWLERERTGAGLLLPGCASVHTFGMRFELDLVFLDRADRPLAVRRRVSPRRLAWHRGAAAVLEVPSRRGESLAAART